MKDFQEWVTDHCYHNEDIWYAEVYKVEGMDEEPWHMAVLSVGPDGVSITLELVENSDVKFEFKRNPGLKRRIRNLRKKAS